MDDSIQRYNQSLIAAALTAVSSTEIISQYEYQIALSKSVNTASPTKPQEFHETNIYTSHMVTGSVPNFKLCYPEIQSGAEEIIIQTPSTEEDSEDAPQEQFITIHIPLRSTVQELKSIIRARKSIPITSQVELLYLGQILLDHHPLCKYIVEYPDVLGPRSLIHNFSENTAPIIKMRILKSDSEISIGYVNSSHLHSEYDRDLTGISKDKKKFFRGGKRYRRPLGWKRYALKVVDEYEDFPSKNTLGENDNYLTDDDRVNNNKWLGRKEQRPEKHVSLDDEWVVAYHGTNMFKGETMADTGYRIASKKQSRLKEDSKIKSIRLLSDGLNALNYILPSLLSSEKFWFSRGVYTTPKIELAEKYATKFMYGGEKYMVLFQNRVRPETLRKVEGGFWISPAREDVRTYGILIRKVVTE